MPAESETRREYKTLSIHRDVYRRLKASKPYESMSFNDLINDMIEDYRGSDREEAS